MKNNFTNTDISIGSDSISYGRSIAYKNIESSVMASISLDGEFSMEYAYTISGENSETTGYISTSDYSLRGIAVLAFAEIAVSIVGAMSIGIPAIML